jgi:hypothetical protein
VLWDEDKDERWRNGLSWGGPQSGKTRVAVDAGTILALIHKTYLSGREASAFQAGDSGDVRPFLFLWVSFYHLRVQKT